MVTAKKNLKTKSVQKRRTKRPTKKEKVLKKEELPQPEKQVEHSEKAKKTSPPLRPPLVTKTIFLKKEDVLHKWYLIDAAGKTLGRLCTSIVKLLTGKNRPDYTKHVAPGDFVVVTNAEKIRLTGKKLNNKKYYWHTGYLGGIKEITVKRLLEIKPEEVIFRAVKGMLPSNHVGRVWLSRLKVYRGPEHPHRAQKPELLNQ